LLLVDPGSTPDCVYGEDLYTFPYIYGNRVNGPDVGHHFALAQGGPGDTAVYVFTVVPSSDTHSAGALIGLSFSDYGTGSTISGTYASGFLGMMDPTVYVPDSPIGAATSSRFSKPIIGVADLNDSTKIDVIAGQTTSWSQTKPDGLNQPNFLVRLPSSTTSSITVFAHPVLLRIPPETQVLPSGKMSPATAAATHP